MYTIKCLYKIEFFKFRFEILTQDIRSFDEYLLRIRISNLFSQVVQPQPKFWVPTVFKGTHLNLKRF